MREKINGISPYWKRSILPPSRHGQPPLLDFAGFTLHVENRSL